MSMERPKYFNGDKLLKLRYEKNISLSNLSVELDIDYKTLWLLENNKCKNPPFATVGKLTEFFKVSIQEFNTYESFFNLPLKTYHYRSAKTAL